MRCFLLGCLGFFIAAILTMIAVASYGDYAARASLSNSMGSTANLKTTIAETILSQGTVVNSGALLKPPSLPLTDYLKVSTDGTIVFRSAAHGQLIVLTPIFKAGSVSWACIGSKPDKNLPLDCRY